MALREYLPGGNLRPASGPTLIRCSVWLRRESYLDVPQRVEGERECRGSYFWVTVVRNKEMGLKECNFGPGHVSFR